MSDNDTDKVDNFDGRYTKEKLHSVYGAIHFPYIREIFHNNINAGVFFLPFSRLASFVSLSVKEREHKLSADKLLLFICDTLCCHVARALSCEIIICLFSCPCAADEQKFIKPNGKFAFNDCATRV